MLYYSFQRSKGHQYAADPSYADVGYSAGIAVLFASTRFAFTTISNFVLMPL